MAHNEWDWDSGDDERGGTEFDSGGLPTYGRDRESKATSFEVIPTLGSGNYGAINTGASQFRRGKSDDMAIRGPSEARLAQYERGFAPSKAFIAGTGGMSFGLQDFNRAGFGNPTWRYYDGAMPEEDRRGEELADIDDFDERGERLQEIAGERPEPLVPGYTEMFAPEAKYYTDAAWRPWFDFTTAGGGWMPESFDEIIGGDTIIPERAILGNFDTGDGDDDDDDGKAAARRKATAPNSERGILGPRQRRRRFRAR